MADILPKFDNLSNNNVDLSVENNDNKSSLSKVDSVEEHDNNIKSDSDLVKESGGGVDGVKESTENRDASSKIPVKCCLQTVTIQKEQEIIDRGSDSDGCKNVNFDNFDDDMNEGNNIEESEDVDELDETNIYCKASNEKDEGGTVIVGGLLKYFRDTAGHFVNILTTKTATFDDDDIPDRLTMKMDLSECHECLSPAPPPPPPLPPPILEAPEEFRCDNKNSNSKQVDISEPEERRHHELVHRDHVNSCKTETGDTIGRRPTDKDNDECNHNNISTEKLYNQQDQTNMISDDNILVISENCIDEGRDCSATSKFIMEMDGCATSNDHQPPLLEPPSIEDGVVECAQASGCSRASTAELCVAHKLDASLLDTSCKFNNNTIKKLENFNTTCINRNNEIQIDEIELNLSWSFRNGRLVFNDCNNDESENTSRTVDETEQVVENDQSDDNDDSIITILHSKDVNKRIDENRSRLKYIEEKLKQAGIVDQNNIENNNRNCYNYNNNNKEIINREDEDCDKQVVDELYFDCLNDNKQYELLVEDLPSLSDGFCEFDVRKVDNFSGFNSNYIKVYDELNSDETNHIITTTTMRDNNNSSGSSMGIDGDRTKHNPDRDNLKSLLKRPGNNSNNKTNKRNNNRVVFNENKNEFFDADYIILIREECDYDDDDDDDDDDHVDDDDDEDDDDDGVCTCNQHEMVRLTCCEPNCNCNVYDGNNCYDQTPQSPKFAPPLEFVDAVTLSPPEGYKDMELGEQQLYALQQMARRGQQQQQQQQRTAVCRECSGAHDDEHNNDADNGDGGPQTDQLFIESKNSNHEPIEEKEKTDQSQQTTPTTPPNDSESPNSQRYILETITMTTVTERSVLKETTEEERKLASSIPTPLPPGGSPINGILKGGRLWKQQSLDVNTSKAAPEPQQQHQQQQQQQQQTTDSSVTSDEEGNTRRSVRFIETEQDKRDVCDGASDNTQEEDEKTTSTTTNNNETTTTTTKSDQITDNNTDANCNNSVSPETTEMMLTFKLGNHVLISNNSLKPNSAVRQLFPCTKPLVNSGKGDDESIHQYLVTAESLRAFEEAKRSKLPQIIQSGETDESIKRAIERNTLRRSLIRYEPRSKKNIQKTDNSLVERIKQLTCNVDDINPEQEEIIPPRASPPGEEARNSPEIQTNNKTQDKSFSPSSSSTASTSSSSMSSTYKKITDLFGKKDKPTDISDNNNKINPSLPDLGNGNVHEMTEINHCSVSKMNSTNESRKQFLSTLAPLTACVSGIATGDEYYYHMNNHVGQRASVASSIGTEYSLEDIDEGLKTVEEETKKIAPDVIAGTPSASESGDELAMFVEQDASRIERIKKKYQPEQSNNKEEDDEHDDYGFNRRPSVRGIKPRFGSTTEILQQIQNQLQPLPPTLPLQQQQQQQQQQPPPPNQPARVAWPYYSESGLTAVDNAKSRNINQNLPNYQYTNVPDEIKTRNPQQQQQQQQHYRPTSLQDENMYQNCTNQRCIREIYRTNMNQTYSAVMKVGGSCTEYYQSMPRMRNGRPQSPPPLELSKNYHQTMVYIPYNHIEVYQSNPYYQNDYVRVSNQNQINKRYIEPIYQQRIHSTHIDEHHHFNPNVLPTMPPKPIHRPPFSQHLVTASRSESPLPGQFSTARSTQTPVSASACNYYGTAPRYRPMMWPPTDNNSYITKINRHSYPTGIPRYPCDNNTSLIDNDSQHNNSNSGNNQISNGYRPSPPQVELQFNNQKDSIPNSPTKPRFIERGVPEGAASVQPQDVGSTAIQQSQSTNSSTMTSPTSPQNPPTNHQQKPLFYAMNV